MSTTLPPHRPRMLRKTQVTPDSYFRAPQEVADEIFLLAISDLEIPGGTINHFVEAARKDLGIGGTVPRGWIVDRGEVSDSGAAGPPVRPSAT